MSGWNDGGCDSDNGDVDITKSSPDSIWFSLAVSMRGLDICWLSDAGNKAGFGFTHCTYRWSVKTS